MTAMSKASKATELLREARDFVYFNDAGEIRQGPDLNLATCIDAFLSQPEPTMSAEVEKLTECADALRVMIRQSEKRHPIGHDAMLRGMRAIRSLDIRKK